MKVNKNQMGKRIHSLFFKVGLFPFKYFQTKAKMVFKATFISQRFQLNARTIWNLISFHKFNQKALYYINI